MRHHNSVFHGLLKHIPWRLFDRLVDEHKADRRVRHLTTKGQFLALLFGQLSGASSLREIEAGLASQSARLYHAGGQCVARSTLADANGKRPAALYGDLFAAMAAAAGRRMRRHLSEALVILDATRLELSSSSAGWLNAQNGCRAVKLHVAYDAVANSPFDVAVTGQRVNDIVPARGLPIEPGMTYVFDLAYYDYAWWAELDASGCRFVTRLKTNTQLRTMTEQPAPEASDILADRIGFLPERLAASRQNPFADPVREVTVKIATGKVIRLVTNDLDASATEIADLYKQRWQIELFFRWIKQNLKLRHFLGASENAVRTQIFVALIAYLVMRAAHAAQNAVVQPLAFVRLVRINLMHRRHIDQLIRPPDPTPKDKRQLTLNLSQT
jgi:hypothetical protein